jgi:hypothetical protein
MWDDEQASEWLYGHDCEPPVNDRAWPSHWPTHAVSSKVDPEAGTFFTGTKEECEQWIVGIKAGTIKYEYNDEETLPEYLVEHLDVWHLPI